MKHNLLQPDSVKKNFAFQIIYQVVILVIPLIVSPYLTRTMGSIALGTYTYTYSIAYYFVVFAMLGINKHGQRIIAQRRNDSEKLRTTFGVCTLYMQLLNPLFGCLFSICFGDLR